MAKLAQESETYIKFGDLCELDRELRETVRGGGWMRSDDYFRMILSYVQAILLDVFTTYKAISAGLPSGEVRRMAE